jgi:hypothetical protein
VQTGPFNLSRTTVRVGIVVAAAVVVLTVAELTSERFKEFTADHSLISTFITEAVLLVGVYLVIDEIIGRRERRRWSDVTSFGMRALAKVARVPAEIIRRVVHELGAETGRETSSNSPPDELGDWLRADDARARSFANEMRRSASSLEEAIIRWGPTIVEDPDSAELLNLLPDVVDAARSAADAIVPAAGWLDRFRGTEETERPIGAWTEEDRQRFRGSLLEILQHVDELDRRLSP